jgi:hypothetical protein
VALPAALVVRAARVNHEGDYVIAVGITPQDASNDDGALETMIGGIEHPI